MNRDLPFDWQSFLDADERLIWVGRPNSGLKLSKAGLVKSASGLPLFALALIGTWLVSGPMRPEDGTAPSDFTRHLPLIAVLFLAVAAYQMFAHYFLDAFRRGCQLYGLTNRRALIVSRLFSDSVKSVPIDRTTVLDYQPHANREASIFFAYETRRREDDTVTLPIGFEHVADGAELYRLMRQVQDNAA
jgi:hypothetical protein